ncbi:MAG TPA: hypothetical protein VFU35_10525 [Jatrophihabitans sp.]|nr:hypothetical protein [Jatrophihabitans sp.]
MRRATWWCGVLVAVALVALGGVAAYRGYARSGGPDAAVRGYFAALARADAPGALAYAATPTGPHTLLTSTVLREQQRQAPITSFRITRSARVGAGTRVVVHYVLAFAGRPRDVVDTVTVRERDGDWRVDPAAITTRLRIGQAADRATLLGAPVPTEPVLLFPGALPIRFDTPNLQVTAEHDHVTFASAATTDVTVALSATGRAAVQSGVRSALGACLAGRGPVTCPLPGDRYVPGSLRGAVPSNAKLSISLGTEGSGVVDVAGNVALTAAYRRLTFENRAVAGHGRIQLPLRAQLYVTRPNTVVWSQA